MENLESLIKRAQANDLSAFSKIVQQFQDMAVGYAYFILRDFHLAQDAAQEAFIEAYCCLSRVNSSDTFSGWFRKIVFKHCDRLTRGKQILTVPLEEVIEIPSAGKRPDETLLEKELKSNVLAAIEGLPENQRIVTTLFYINGYSQNEISDFLEIPVTTVKKRLQYSRKRLKERMIKMVQSTLLENRPSRDEKFGNMVSKNMFGGIAEQLRNSLGVISSTTQFLLKSCDDTLVHESAKKIRTEVQIASLIIENLLIFSRTEEMMKDIDLHAVLQETFSLFTKTSKMQKQKVSLQKKLSVDLPMVCDRPEFLQYAFTHLIINACHAMPQGGTLTVTTQKTKEAEVQIRFSDTGVGIPSEYLPKVFDPFFTTRRDGVGLGLPMSSDIIQQHKGTIEVKSQEGKGTTFIVTLPIKRK